MHNNIAVIILNYNDYYETEKCVDNLLRLNVDAEIIIVDNFSTNESVKYLIEKYKNIKNITIISNNENRGYAAGNNVGFKYVVNNMPEVKYMCVMNPDTLFDDPELLNKLAMKLSKHDRAGVIAPVMVQHGLWDIKKTYWDIPTTWDLFRRQFVFCKKRNQSDLFIDEDKVAYVGVVSGSFFMIKKSALEQIGYLDESTFLYCEENMLSLDLRDVGLGELLSVTDVFFHNHKKRNVRQSLKKKLQIAKIASKSRISVFTKHYSKAYIPLLCIIYCINVLLITIKHLCGSIIRSLK